jgi:hypothetical protein
MRLFVFTAILFLMIPAVVFSVTIRVPNDWPTIQQAISAAPQDALILVMPGTYKENITLLGKRITVRSDIDGNENTVEVLPALVVIDGMQTGSVVRFDDGETHETVLQGFTLTNGSGTNMGGATFGGGVFCLNASPTLKNLFIDQNIPVDMGGGIFCHIDSSPRILGCAIHKNHAVGATHGKGGGIACWLNSDPLITNCTIYNNSADNGGGGVWCFYESNVEAWNTIFANNSAPNAPEIWVGTTTFPSSFFVRNSLIEEGGIGDPPPTYVSLGSSWDEANIVTGNPELLNPKNSNLRLTTKSGVCISAGDNNAPGLDELSHDVYGQTVFPHQNPQFAGTRIIEAISSNGNLNNVFIVDLGCHEFKPHYVPTWFSTIQQAVPATIKGNTILVMPGVHKGSVNFQAKEITVRSDEDGKASTKQTARDTTILDGMQAGSVVIFNSKEKAASRLNSFIIRNGKANFGGGVHLSDSSPTLENLIVTENEATTGGGGFYASNSAKPKVFDCEVSYNTAGQFGGGLYLTNNTGTSTWEGNDFRNNTAGVAGGGLAVVGSGGTIQDNDVHQNDAPKGAGIYVKNIPAPSVNNNRIYQNPTTHPGSQFAEYGGGVCVEDGSFVTFSKNTIYENSARYGGGVYCDSSPLKLESNILYKNWAHYGGGLAYSKTGSKITHNTLYKNHADIQGGGVYWTDAITATLANSLLWNNTAPEDPSIVFIGVDTPEVTHCNVSITDPQNPPAWYDYYTCIRRPPVFEVDDDPLAKKFLRLAKESPGINMGSYEHNIVKDIDDESRPHGGNPDMGADEFKGTATNQYYFRAKNLNDNKYKISISETNPNPVELVLDAGTSNKNRMYFVLGSVSWCAPGIPLPSGKLLPCTWDFLTDLVILSYFVSSPFFIDFNGTLNTQGTRTAKFDYGGALIPGMEGMIFTFAYSLRGPGAPWDVASNPVNIHVVE